MIWTKNSLFVQNLAGYGHDILIVTKWRTFTFSPKRRNLHLFLVLYELPLKLHRGNLLNKSRILLIYGFRENEYKITDKSGTLFKGVKCVRACSRSTSSQIGINVFSHPIEIEVFILFTYILRIYVYTDAQIISIYSIPSPSSCTFSRGHLMQFV